jgi:hypothetical protein
VVDERSPKTANIANHKDTGHRAEAEKIRGFGMAVPMPPPAHLVPNLRLLTHTNVRTLARLLFSVNIFLREGLRSFTVFRMTVGGGGGSRGKKRIT